MLQTNHNPTTVVLITRNGMGHADQTLQHKLMTTYFNLLNDSNTLPAAICFYAEGVKLATTGSLVLESLRALEAKGVHLVLCNTCLNHYGLQNQVEVGVVGGMTDIIEAQWRADKVITL
jgi:sulfur relay (sulfurtransferase) complex TusBCD TusD component (DsrE family)